MITILFIVITVLISITAFNNRELYLRFMFNAYQIYHRKQYFRLLSHGFIHADWTHLIFNMITLFFFGKYVEEYMNNALLFITLYLGGIIIASLSSLFKHKDNYVYNSVGASGGVAAVLFASILFNPWLKIYFFFIPVGIPGVIFGIIYLLFSNYMSKKDIDNINHDAHFLGAVFGFTFPILIHVGYLYNFIDQLTAIFR